MRLTKSRLRVRRTYLLCKSGEANGEAAQAGGLGPYLGRAWWRPRRPWPRDLRFEDGETKRVLDRTMPAPELPVGTYASTGGLCIESRFAEGEVDARV